MPVTSHICPVCEVEVAGSRSSVLGDQHFDMRIRCPICWERFQKIGNLGRHLSRKHPDHPLTHLQDDIKTSTGFYLAYDPLRWNPSIKLDKNHRVINLIKRLYADNEDYVFPDKRTMKCPRTIQEAKNRGLAKPVKHHREVDGALGKPIEDVADVKRATPEAITVKSCVTVPAASAVKTSKRRDFTPETLTLEANKRQKQADPGYSHFKFALVEIKLLHLEQRVVRIHLAYRSDGELDAVYQIDVAVSSLAAVTGSYRKPLPRMGHRETSEINRELTHRLRELEGDLHSFRARIFPYLGCTPEQIIKVGAVIRPNAAEYSQMQTYRFLLQTLPEDGQQMRGLVFFARCLNLKNFVPADLEKQLPDNNTMRPPVACEDGSSELPALFPGTTTATLDMPTLRSLGLETESDSDSNITPYPDVEIGLPSGEEVGASHSGGTQVHGLPTPGKKKQQCGELRAETGTSALAIMTQQESSAETPEMKSQQSGDPNTVLPTTTENTVEQMLPVASNTSETSCQPQTSRKEQHLDILQTALQQTLPGLLEADTNPVAFATSSPRGHDGSVPEPTISVVQRGELEDAAIATALRTPSPPPQGPVIVSSLGLPAKLPYTGVITMYNRFKVPVGTTGDRCTRINNLILQQDREQNPLGFQLLIPHGYYPMIRPARRNWKSAPHGHIRIPLYPGHTRGVIWPPQGWCSLTPKQRRNELIQLGQTLDMAWYGLQECRNAIDIGERYYAFTLPYSVKPGDNDYTDQAYDQDRFQTRTRHQIRLHEITARRLGLWQSLPPELYADQAAQDSWDNQRMLQLPRPVREALDHIPTFIFNWDNKDTGIDEGLL